ncbi:HSF-type DNA-binding domain protein [Trichinella nativa]|uniref:HSF-type DNA-binding domain protein n=1 Tax=Trichinella nativa TaxID=6335 RepID=A0A1Y3EZ90_9BILA|nr:HSF-type DNA-binding domain protein [Trichinella nativa]
MSSKFKVSSFLSTLRFILDSEEYNNAVCWDDTGTVFCIKDQECGEVSDGFHKVNAVNIVPPLHANVPCFSHKYFLRGEPSLDVNIRRKCYQEKSPPPLTRDEETVTYADVIRVVMRMNEQLSEITKRVSKLEKEMVDARKYMPNWCITTFLQLLTAASQKQGTVDLLHLLHMLTQTQYKANRQNSNGKSVPYVPIVKSQSPKNGLRVNTIGHRKRKQELNSVESTPPPVVGNDANPSVVAGPTDTTATPSLTTSGEDVSESFAVCTTPAYTDAIMTYNNVENQGNVLLDGGCLDPLPPPPPQQQQHQPQPQPQPHPAGDSMITYPCTWDLPGFDDISANFLTDDSDSLMNMEFDYYGGINWRTESADLITFTGGDRVQRVHSASSTSSFSSCIDEEIEFPNSNNLSTVQEVSAVSNVQPSGTQPAPSNEPNNGGMENNTVFKPLTNSGSMLDDDMYLSNAYNDMLNTPKVDELSHEDLIAEFLLPMTQNDCETFSNECDLMVSIPQPSFVSEQPMAVLQSDVQNLEIPLANNNPLNNGDQGSLNSASLSSMLSTVKDHRLQPSSTTIQSRDESQLPLVGPENGSQKEENHINVSSSILGRRSSTTSDVPCSDAFQSSSVKSRKRTEKKNDPKAASCLKMFNLTDAKTGKKITCRVIRR